MRANNVLWCGVWFWCALGLAGCPAVVELSERSALEQRSREVGESILVDGGGERVYERLRVDEGGGERGVERERVSVEVGVESQSDGMCKGGVEECNGKDNNCDGVIDCSVHSSDVKALVQGVTRIGAPGVPGSLAALSRVSFVVAAGPAGDRVFGPVGVGAKWGKGRVFAFGHGGYLSGAEQKVGDTGQFLENVLRWSGEGKQASSLRVGLYGLKDLEPLLAARGFAVVSLGGDWVSKLVGIDVLLMKAPGLRSMEEGEAVLSFVKGGGGFVSGETGWGWAQLNPEKSIVSEHVGNRILSRVGIVWTAQFLRDSATGYGVAAPLDRLLHTQDALDLLVAHAKGSVKPTDVELEQAAYTLTQAIPYLAEDDPYLRPRLRMLSESAGPAQIPGPDQPVRLRDALRRVLLSYQLLEARRLKPEEVKAHPASSLFPGSVPVGAKRLSSQLEIDTRIPDWHSTGLYAVAGELVKVTIPSGAIRAKLSVRVGAHKDQLWHLPEWKRVPEISRQWSLKSETTKLASAFGGVVYIVVPKGSVAGKIQVKIEGVVQAPLFVLGRTSVSEWKQSIRDFPGPWAELASEKLILTVPSKVIRKLDAPDRLMVHWDQVLDACAALGTTSKVRLRPERVVMDEQISAGYMHSGYPIMTHLDVQNQLSDPDFMVKNGGWGIYHELGHNHQSGHWTFDGTGEVTVNLFTLYIFEMVHKNVKPRTNIYGVEREKQVRAYILGGARFTEWKSKPFLALIMYMQLQEAFGWKVFQQVFAGYLSDPSALLPKTDDEKRDQWMVRFSKAVGKNLGPFFEAWGVPTSVKARQSVSSLGGWMPAGFPPKP